MIATQEIRSTTQKPIEIIGYEVINVLKWNKNYWKELCPYCLKTDGKELYKNNGGILFENYYQGSKVYDIIYENEVYPSRYQIGNPKYLWWKFEPINENGDIIVQNNHIVNIDLYYRWRDSLWNCPHPIRYPNKIHRRKNTQFALCIDENNQHTQYDYLSARRILYINEYIRLIKQLSEYQQLLEKLWSGENIMICEMDVPSQNKSGHYGKDCDENNICHMTIDKLELLINDPSEAFGHGLCLAYSLLLDLKNGKC